MQIFAGLDRELEECVENRFDTHHCVSQDILKNGL